MRSLSTSGPSPSAAAMWRGRAAAELDAAARFERIAERLAAVGADPAVIALARTAADDEVRHFALCSDLTRHFGAEPPCRSARSAGPLLSGATSDRQQVLYEVVAMSCVTESISTAVLIQICNDASDRAVRDVAHTILKDEVRHARLGWAHLAAEAGRVDLGFIGLRLPAMLRRTVAEELFEDGGHEPEVFGLGGLDRAGRRRVFLATMHDVVLPGLERFGVDTQPARAWLDAKRTCAN